MSLHNYIEVSNLTHIHIKQFPVTLLQSYLDEANAMYEDLGLTLGVLPEQLVYPTPIICVRYLNAYVTYRFAEDSIATNNVENTDDDMYKFLGDEFKTIAYGLKKQITPQLLMGVSMNNRASRSISTGRSHRTS
jgi:hypothetical protein